MKLFSSVPVTAALPKLAASALLLVVWQAAILVASAPALFMQLVITLATSFRAAVSMYF